MKTAKKPSLTKAKKRNPIKTIKNKLDVIFSKVVRKRGYCERCGQTEYSKLQCSHIHSREKFSVRWDLKNAFCFCAGCHMFWWHKHPIMAAEFAKEKLGEYEYTSLLHRANTIKKWTQEELLELNLTLNNLYQGV